MFPNRTSRNPAEDIGARNIEAGHHLLNRYGFKLANEHVGGTGHRRLMQDLWNGDVWMKFTDNKMNSGAK